ncbi:antigen 5 like allergen Cul n 1 [Drosophila grimshawi]|uniref:Venom allergen-1 n=1 Tax=Drosophila grimshawi TaxID=7222 RepID=B4JJN5_DROGR|nr:antigen 5 like allergen Cul n 1 [Drosophila grimshawi]EDV99787.1 GH12214 [Drosophila grimshawi]
MRNILSITILALALGIACAFDYCTRNCGTTPNIGCNNDGSWASTCPPDKTLLTLTTAEKNAIVAKHNEHRNFIAGGGDSKLSPACRMATMEWDNDLAYLASLNVKSCEMRHDKCRKTAAFDWAGQNLAWIGYFDPLNSLTNAIRGVDMWYDEVADTTQAHIDAYPSNYNGPAIGHFTVMVADRNTRVGCAVSTYSVTGQSYKAYLMACNYAATNVIGIKMYTSCAVGASSCTTGVNPSYPFLCSSSEVYDPNNLYY